MHHISIQKISGIFICLVCLLFPGPQLFSQESEPEPIGKVIAIRGKAVALQDGTTSRKLFLKAPVFLKDKIKTQSGRVQMMFKDHTLITLGRNSELHITKYLWEPQNSDSAMETHIKEGSFRIMGGAITRISPDNFKTDSPSGTIGIRGSMYAGQVKTDTLFVLFQGGKGIYVQNPDGMVEITRPGFGTRVEGPGAPPAPPAKVPMEALQEMEEALASAPAETNEPLPSKEGTASSEPTEKAENIVPKDEDPAGTPEEASGESEDSSLLSIAIEEDGTLGGSSTLPETPPIEDSPTETTGLEPAIQDIITDTEEITTASIEDSLNDVLAPVGTEDEIQLMLLDLGATDIIPSTDVPGSGIWHYQGTMKNTLDQADTMETIKFIVNWENRRIIGFEDSFGAAHGFAFGTINTDGTISGVTVLGSDAHADMGGVMALTGSETFGQFYGAAQGGLGLAMEGYDYNIQDQSIFHPWSDLLAATLESTAAVQAFTSPETWSGFFVGISENMMDPNNGRRIFYNSYAGTSFALTLDKNNGTFTGTLVNGQDFNLSGLAINTGAIGGSAANSVYIDDKTLAATINSADISPLAVGLKPHGNFLVTANEPMLSAYTTWGYWEVAYEESLSPADDYHLHVPGSRWIAGVQASLPASFIGTYQGNARGVVFDSTSQMQDLSGGTVNLNVDFSGVSTPVTGSINFNELPSPFTVTTSSAAALAAAGFNATIIEATRSHVNGAFFGPTIPGGSSAGPAAVGGNFGALMPDGKQYHGIFGGDLQ